MTLQEERDMLHYIAMYLQEESSVERQTSDWGNKVLSRHFRPANASHEEKMDALYDDSVAYGVSCAALSAIQFVLGILMVDLLNIAASRQISKVRKMFLKAVLRQDMAWYDTNTSTNFASRITEWVFFPLSLCRCVARDNEIIRINLSQSKIRRDKQF